MVNEGERMEREYKEFMAKEEQPKEDEWTRRHNIIRAERRSDREEREAKTEEAKAQKQYEQEQRRIEARNLQYTRKGVKIATNIATNIIQPVGRSLWSRMRGVRHPDSLISKESRPLYMPVSEKFTPLGRFFENPMELYYGKAQRRMPENSAIVFAAVKQGYQPNELEVVTGLPPSQINRSVAYLIDKKLIPRDYLA